MILTNNLIINYKANRSIHFNDVSIKKGEQWLLKGDSGTGKTTLLHLLSGILLPSSGTIEINGSVINELSRAQLDQYRAQNIGLIFQKNLFVSSLSMYNNLILPIKLAGNSIDKTFVNQLTDELGITKLIHKRPHELSQGEQQRFSIARALVNKPSVILADEPSSSLDDTNCKRFADMISTICNSYEVTLLIATHDGRLEAQIPKVINLNRQ